MPRPRARRIRRRGVILVLACFVGGLILSLGFLYHQSLRDQHPRSARHEGRLVTEFLAESALEYVVHLIRDAADPGVPMERRVQPSASLFDLARQLPSEIPGLSEDLQDRFRRREDDRLMVDHLFGKGTARGLDLLEEASGEGKVKVRLSFEAEPLPGLSDWPESGVVDRLEKTLVVTVTAEATMNRVTTVREGREYVVVYSLASPVLGRFTGNTGFMWHGPRDEFPEDLLDESEPDQDLHDRDTPALSPEKAEAEYLEGGWVYPRWQSVLAGGGTFGQHYLLWRTELDPVEGRYRPLPSSIPLPEQPTSLKEGYFPEPGTDGAVLQRPALAALVQGTADARRGDLAPTGEPWRDGLAHDPAGECWFDKTVGMFGTSQDPSPTLAPGTVARAYAASAVVVDRDDRDLDEDAQRAEVGQDLPRREAFLYVLSQAPRSEGEFQDERDRERRTQTPSQRIRGIPGAPVEGAVVTLPNLNLMADLDGNGSRETPVEAEADHPEVRLEAALYRPFQLFPGWYSYQQVASRPLDFPMDLVHDLSTRPVAETQRRLVGKAWSTELAMQDGDPARVPPELMHRDALRRTAGDEERRHYRYPQGELPIDAYREQVRRMDTRWMPTVRVGSQELLETYFPDADLQGHRIMLAGPLPCLYGEMRLDRQYHSGYLRAGGFLVETTVEEQPENRLLELRASQPRRRLPRPTLVFLDPGVHHLLAVADMIATPGATLAAPVRVRGTSLEVWMRYGTATPRTREDQPRLVTAWDRRRDPLGEDRHMGYRLAPLCLRGPVDPCAAFEAGLERYSPGGPGHRPGRCPEDADG